MSKGGMVEAFAPDLKDWRSILEAFRRHDWISTIVQDTREIKWSEGLMVGRETFNDPYANAI